MTVKRTTLASNPHPLAQLRVAWSTLEGTHRYLRPLTRHDTIFPDVLPTAQASLRWSTTRPPLTNFPAELRDGTEDYGGKYLHEPWASGIIMPEAGTWWLKYDQEAVEARLEALLSDDQGELDAYAQGLDVHTRTACHLFNLPMPPLLTKALHTSGEASEWRQCVDWEGSEDRRRHIAKTTRYALQYSPDEKGILENHELIAKVGRQKALEFARLYLSSRPALQAMKRRVGDVIVATGTARTAFGHPRQVFGDERQRRKEGIAHTISGTVANMGNLIAIAIQATFPSAWLVKNDHDSQTWAFSRGGHGECYCTSCFDTSPAEVIRRVRGIVERPWELPAWEKVYTFPASWYAYSADGKREKVI